MKHALPILLCAILAACTPHKPTVAVTAVTGNSIRNAVSASERSSRHIKSFRTKAEEIDYKATRALEL